MELLQFPVSQFWDCTFKEYIECASSVLCFVSSEWPVGICSSLSDVFVASNCVCSESLSPKRFLGMPVYKVTCYYYYIIIHWIWICVKWVLLQLREIHPSPAAAANLWTESEYNHHNSSYYPSLYILFKINRNKTMHIVQNCDGYIATRSSVPPDLTN
jgi:hypothetical protein